MTTTSNTGSTAKTEYHEFTWTSGHISIRIEVAFTPRANIYDHMGIRSIEPEKAPLPISQTGYRSHHSPLGAVAECGGPEAATRILLEEAAASVEWQEYLLSARQGSLF